jgi:hypothetical protein
LANVAQILFAQLKGTLRSRRTLIWQGPDRRPLRDSYDLFVATDGCFDATVAGENLGGPTLKTRDRAR